MFSETHLVVAFLAVVTLLSVLVLTIAYLHSQLTEAQLRSARLEKQLKTKEYNGAARATIKGQVAEQVAPMLPGFPFHPSDFRFQGHPIDYIAFVGLTEAKEGLGDIKEIVIGDIKMNRASLSPHQRMIKRAVEEGRVRWETIHIGEDFTVSQRRGRR